MTLTPAELQAKCRAVACVLDHVGEEELASSFWAAVATTKALEESGNTNFDVEMFPVVDALEQAIDVTTLKTSDMFNRLRSSSFTLLDVVGPYWHHLAERWAKRRTKFQEMWQIPADAATAFAEAYDIHGGTTDTDSGYVHVYPEAASVEFVAALQQLSAEHPALRLMFIEASDPDIVYAASVHNEEVVTSMLSPYTKTLWRGTAHLGNGSEVSEFTVYNVNGHRIFRVPGTLAACDKSALDLLVTGELIPRMASIKTASVLRLTFSLRAVANPEFKDFLRSLGGEPASPVSWDVPILQEADIENTFALVRERFGYPIMLYQIVDTPKQNIWAFTNPEAQAVRVLSAPVKKHVAGNYKVRAASTKDISAQLSRAIASGKLTSQERLVIERVAGACRVVAYAVVTLADETPAELTTMFPGARVDAEASEGVYLIPHEGFTQVVTTEAIAPQSTALTPEEAAGPCECQGADCACDDSTAEDEWILNVSMGNPTEYHEGEVDPVEVDDQPETPEATQVEPDRPFEDPPLGGDAEETAEGITTIVETLSEGLPAPLAQIVDSLPVCETCTAPLGSNPECGTCNAHWEQISGEETSGDQVVEAGIDDTDLAAVDKAVSSYLRTVPGVDVHDVQHFEDESGKGITYTADLYEDAIGQLGMSAPTGPSLDSGLAVTVSHNDDDSIWVTVSSGDETHDNAMVTFSNGKSKASQTSKKPMRNELAAEIMKIMLTHTGASEAVEAESGLGLNNPAVHEMNAAEDTGVCQSCGGEYGVNIDCPECAQWEPGMKSAAPKAVHLKFAPFSKPKIYGDTAWSAITMDGTNIGEINRNTDYDWNGMSRAYYVDNYEVRLDGMDMDVEKTFPVNRRVQDGARKALADAKAFVRKTVSDSRSAPVTVDLDNAKLEEPAKSGATLADVRRMKNEIRSDIKTSGKPERTTPYEKAKKLDESAMLALVDSIIKRYDREAHNPLGGESDDISPIETLPADADILFETGEGSTWRAVIDYPRKRRMAVMYRVPGRHYPTMLYFAGDTKVPRKAAFMEDVINVFFTVVEGLKKTPHISDVTVHKSRNPGFGAATLTVSPDSLNVFGLESSKMNKGVVEVDVFVYDDGIANVQLSADGKSVVTHIDDGTSRVMRKSPGVNSNLVGLAAQITKPMTDVTMPKAAITASDSFTLDKSTKDKINADFRKNGFDGNLRFRTIGSALAAAERTLNDSGFEFDEVSTKGMYLRDEGTRSIDIAKTGEDAFSPVSVKNSALFFQWSKYGDTPDFSVVAYLG